MITVTPEAAAQIRLAATHNQSDKLPLRIAVERRGDGSFDYRMGFDEQKRPDDVELTSEGVALVIDSASMLLCKGMMLDFVDLDGSMAFVFMNPNDPRYRPPQE